MNSPDPPDASKLIPEPEPVEPKPDTKLIARQQTRARERQTSLGDLLIPSTPSTSSSSSAGVLIPTSRNT